MLFLDWSGIESMGKLTFTQFAVLTPLEPRLVRKLLPPLTDLIRTTPAMSLLYECINGIIQGGILDSADVGAEEIAVLCVNKLRGMIMIDGDPNRELFSPMEHLCTPRTNTDKSNMLRCWPSTKLSLRTPFWSPNKKMLSWNALTARTLRYASRRWISSKEWSAAIILCRW